LALQSIFIHTSNWSSTCLALLRHEADGFTSLRRKVCCGFFALKNPSPSVGFEPANLGSYDKHDNHWTTEDDVILVFIYVYFI
jgi:hypothetical protein